MRASSRSSDAAPLALSLLAAICLAAACTHVTPYYRGGAAPEVAGVDPASVDHRLLLIGDAGDPDPDGEPTLQLLAEKVRMMPDRTTVAFLGDNVYERGMPRAEKTKAPVAEAAEAVVDTVVVDVFDDRKAAEKAIGAQIDVVRGTKVKGIFIPGNHDWDQFEVGGWDRILSLEDYLRAASNETTDVALRPPGGCPGPESFRLGRKGALVVVDTQWWLETRVDGKPTADRNPTGCPVVTEKAVRDALVDQLDAAAADGRWTVLAGHHPLESEGPHGGFTDPWTHLFPFQIVRHYVPFYISWIPVPVVGSMVVGARACCSPSAQDMSNGRNLHMRNFLEYSMLQAEKRGAAPVAYAAGHDHSLQVFESKKGPRYLLVSGLGSKSRASDVGSDGATLFAHSNSSHPGFMQIDFLTDGAVRLGVWEVMSDAPEGREVYARFLAEPGERPGAPMKTANGKGPTEMNRDRFPMSQRCSPHGCVDSSSQGVSRTS